MLAADGAATQILLQGLERGGGGRDSAHCLQHQNAALCGEWHGGSKGVQGCDSRDTYRGAFELLHQLTILLLQLLVQVLNLLLLGLQLLLQLLRSLPRESTSERQLSSGHTQSYVKVSEA